MNIALIHEWLVTYAGSERVVEHILNLYPQADLYSLVDFLGDEQRAFIQHKSVQTSFLQRLPFANPHFRQYLPFMPLAIEQFDLSAYDLVLSSNHAVAKGVLTRPDQLHICYMHTPIRYAWDLQHQYLQSHLKGLKGLALKSILHYLRLWDLATANRVDHFVANSHYVARRIWKTYRRRAPVVYPPVAIDRFYPHLPREPFYFTLSRFVPYKRVDLIVSAFNRLGYPLVIIGDGSERQRIQTMAKPNIQCLGHQPDSVVIDHMQRCKAFVYAAEEDFGITLVEAQAAGAPVITYGKGGATESVIVGKTGLFFADQTPESLVETVKLFESGAYLFNPDYLRQNAEKFAPDRFQQNFSRLVEQKWSSFRQEMA